MGFKKAESNQAYLKWGLYGPYGSGKTFTSLLIAEGLARTMRKRVAFVDTEAGTDFYAMEIPERKIHPQAFDFDRIETKSLVMTLDEVKHIDPEVYGVVVIDSITHLWEVAIEGYGGKTTSTGSIPFHAWGAIKKPYKALVNALMNGNFHALILGRQKNIFGEDDTGETKLQGVTMKAEGDTPYEPHVLIRMIREVSKKSTEVAPVAAFFEKDRTGILGGQTIILPPVQEGCYTFDKLAEPFLSVLGGSQAQMMSSSEAGRGDAEHNAGEQASRDVASAALREDFKSRMQLAKTIKALDVVAKEITREVKMLMVAPDVAALKKTYTDKIARLNGVG